MAEEQKRSASTRFLEAGRVGIEAPDLAGVGNVPAEFVCEDALTDLVVVAGADLAGLRDRRELLLDGLRLRDGCAYSVTSTAR